MATVALATSFESTTDASSFTSSAFMPAANDLLVCVFSVPDLYTSAGVTHVEDSQGGVWTLNVASYYTGIEGGTYEKCVLAVRNSGVSASSMTVTVYGKDGGSVNPMTSIVCSIYTISGMALYGSSAVRQWAVEFTTPNYYGTGTPSVTLSAALLSANPVLAVVVANAAPGLAAPSGFTQRYNAGVTVKSIGEEVWSCDGGLSSSVVSWSSALRHNAIVMEFDTTGGTPWEPPAPAPPDVDPIWINSYEIKVLTGR